MADFMDAPEVTLKPSFMTKEDLPVEIRESKNFKEIEGLFKTQEDGNFEKGYLDADRLSRTGSREFLEWVLLLKADFLYRVQAAKDEPHFASVLEEYQDILRRFPLHSESARILYQQGLIQLALTYYKDTEETATRGLKEFGSSKYGPLYVLLKGEQFFRAGNFPQALGEFTSLVNQYPRHIAAVDAAFRKAFIHFRRGDYELALKTYENLEKFHSNEIKKLKERDPSDEGGRLIDRAYYAETLYLNGLYQNASNLFQDLANLFPSDPMAPFLAVRFGDTFYQRGQFRAAEQLYRSVLERENLDARAEAFAKLKLADLFFVTKDIRAHRENEKAYEDVYNLGLKAKHQELAAFGLARLAAHHLAFRSFPKAQEILKQYLKEFKETRNENWAKQKYASTVELQIRDYYRRGDYLAALATYLVAETDTVKDTKVLLALAEAANRLSLYESMSQILNRVIYLEKSSEGRQEALLKLVDVLIQQGDYRKAAERLRRFNFAYPTTPIRFLYDKLWGDLYTKLKNSEKAVQHYEMALEGLKSLPSEMFEFREVYLTLGEHYEKLALPGKAIDSYNRYIKFIDGLKAAPLAEFQVTARDDFLMTSAKFKIADLHFSTKDFIRAIDSYKSIIASVKTEPFLTHARYRLGECYLALDDRTSAVSAFKEIPSTDPANLWFRAADSYIKTVDMEVRYGIRILN